MIPSWLSHIILQLSGAAIVGQLVLRQYKARYYVNRCPDAPMPAEGRTYPLTVSGKTVFLTDNESYWFDKRSRWTIALPAIVGMIAILASSRGR
jgi:hypothetical protein